MIPTTIPCPRCGVACLLDEAWHISGLHHARVQHGDNPEAIACLYADEDGNLGITDSERITWAQRQLAWLCDSTTSFILHMESGVWKQMVTVG